MFHSYAIILAIITLIVLSLFLIINLFRKFRKQDSITSRKKLLKLIDKGIEMRVSEFFEIRDLGFKFPEIADHCDFTGIYILRNKTKEIYYVGQSKNVFPRVYAHFMGRGNEYVYRDYIKGDNFTIKVLALNGSVFRSLNEMEKVAIVAYDAFENGYNKTRGGA